MFATMHPRTVGQAQKDLTESAMVLPTARDTQSVRWFLVVEDIAKARPTYRIL